MNNELLFAISIIVKKISAFIIFTKKRFELKWHVVLNRKSSCLITSFNRDNENMKIDSMIINETKKN